MRHPRQDPRVPDRGAPAAALGGRAECGGRCAALHWNQGEEHIMLRLREAINSLTPYVPGRSIETIERETGLSDLVKLNQNESATGPSPRAMAAAMEAVGRLHRYPEGTSHALREKLAALWHLPAEWILVGNGSDEIFRLLAETYLEPGDAVVVPVPSFAGYPLVAQLMGARVVDVRLAGDAMDLTAMVRAVHQTGARFLFLCRPNSPTGGVFDEEALRAALDHLPDDVLVILDEAYAEFDETPFDSRDILPNYPNLVITRTFSKIYGLAGLRLGYGIMHPDLIAPLYRVRDPFSVNSMALAAGAAALDDREHVTLSREVNRRGKQFLYALFDSLGVRYVPTQANFILFYTAEPAGRIADALLQQRVMIRPCASFGLPNALRVTIGTQAENERFAEALRAIL